VLLPALFAILLGAVGAFVTLVAFGEIKVDAPGLARFFGGERGEEPMITQGAVAVPVGRDIYTPPSGYDKEDWVALVVKPIPAYSLITREHMTFERNQKPWPRWTKPEEVGKDWMRRPGDAMGRVAAFDIPMGTVLTEGALLPVGTRPGLMGAIPSGMRGLVIPASTMDGAYALRQGDHVDIFATFSPVDQDIRDLSRLGRGVQPIVTGDMISAAGLVRPELRVIVENALVVKPVQGRLTTDRRERIVEELSIAGDPDEIAALTEALKMKANLYAVVRPGSAGSDPNEKLRLDASADGPGSTLCGIEQVVGDKRTLTVISGGK
jgi:hypothetical protein